MSVIDMRVSAPLPAGGAYDSAPSEKPLSATTFLVALWCDYTEGAAGGTARVRVECSPDGVVWHRTIAVTAVSSGGERVIASEPSVLELPPGTGTTVWSLELPPGTAWIRTPAAEVGVPATPGTLALRLTEEP